MSMNLTQEGQQKIKEDYERHQLEYNSKIIEENKNLKAHLEELVAERKGLHKDITKHRLQFKNQERTIQQLSDMLDMLSRHNSSRYPPHSQMEDRGEASRLRREEDNNKGSSDSLPAAQIQRSLYDMCETRNKTLQEYGSSGSINKELKDAVDVLS